MRKRLKKKLFKSKFSKYCILTSNQKSLYEQYNETMKKIQHDWMNSFIENWWKIVFIPKNKSKSKYNDILQKNYNEDIKDKWLNFNTIIIDECYTIENEHT